MAEHILHETPRLAKATLRPENASAGGGGTEPAISEIQRSMIELRAIVSHVLNVDDALRLREDLNSLAIELGVLSDFAGARAERLLRGPK